MEQEINRQPDVIVEGRVAADLDPGLECDGPVSTGGIWSQYVQRVAEETYTHYRRGCTAGGTRDTHPDETHGGTVFETVIPAYQSEPQDSPYLISTPTSVLQRTYSYSKPILEI